MSDQSHPEGHAPIRLPLQLRGLNALGPVAQRLGLSNLHDDPEPYIQWARKKTGLNDFGPYDIREPLQRMLYTMKNETGLSLFGRIGSVQMIRRNLVNNLLLQQVFATHLEVEQVDVESPIIIICTPRTGSTLLHNLLSLPSQVRSVKMWELHRPCPPPRPELDLIDERIKLSDREFGMFYRLVPEMRAIHFFAPEAVEECTHLFGNIFTCRLSFSTLSNRSSYSDWIMQQDMTAAYRAYKRHLQVLKLHYPQPCMVLKSPVHIMQLDALEQVFPKARIVHLHRDPATAAGSFCSLTEAVQISMREQVDPLAIGKMWNEFWTPSLLGSVEWRQRTKLSVIDVNFGDLVKNPVTVVSQLFEQFGETVDDSLPGQIEQYLSNHPKDEYGIHRYNLERYGLNRQQLYADSQPYIDAFSVPLEQQLAEQQLAEQQLAEQQPAQQSTGNHTAENNTAKKASTNA